VVDEPDFSVVTAATGAGGSPAVLVLTGELDAYAAERLTAEIDRVDPGATAIELDVAAVSFVDSSGLRVLLKASDRLGARRRTVLRDAPAALVRLLELTGLLDHFEFAG